MAWDDDDVERWLTDWPLPKDFTWKGETVWPRYELKKGYGFWLRTAGPYHPAMRGLFDLIAGILKAIPAGTPMPSPEQLQAEVKAYESVQDTLGLPEEEDDAAAIERAREEHHEAVAAARGQHYQGAGVTRAQLDREDLGTPLAAAWPAPQQHPDE